MRGSPLEVQVRDWVQIRSGDQCLDLIEKVLVILTGNILADAVTRRDLLCCLLSLRSLNKVICVLRCSGIELQDCRGVEDQDTVSIGSQSQVNPIRFVI